VDGIATLFVERGGRRLLTLDSDDARRPVALAALAAWVRASPRRRLALERVDGRSIFETPIAEQLVAVGFHRGLRAIELRSDDRPPAGHA
jgi:ATP-dependent Lhr-like helicase